MAASEHANSIFSAGGHPPSCQCAGCFGGASSVSFNNVLASPRPGMFSGLRNWASNMLGMFQKRQFSPEEDLLSAPGVDPRLLPRVKMTSEGLDEGTLAGLSGIGMRRGKLVTAESHPELYTAWQTLCARAGMPKAPQLILTESPAINAMTISPEEVAVTTGLLKLLNLREVMAVLGHELGHERYGESHNFTRTAAQIGFVGAGALAGNHIGSIWGDYARAHPGWLPWQWRPGIIGGAALIAGVGYAGHVAANQVSVKPTELQADLEGAAISGDPQALISALEKLDTITTHKARNPWEATKLFRSGYPTLRERIDHLKEALAKMPLPNLPPPIVSAANASPAQPASQVSAITVAERVYYAPEASHSIVH